MPSFSNLIDLDRLSYFKSKLDLLFSNKVDKETGKGLSSNDYTSEEKTKLANVATGAQVNVLEGVQVNGSTITPTNKIANIPVPTKTSDITNDSGFITSADIPEGSAASTTVPLMDGTAAVGNELAFARGDHRHPTDTSRASASDLSTHTGDSIIHITSAERSAWNAKADASSVYTKSEVDQKLVGAMNYKGTVATTSALPSSGNNTGDVYHVTADGSEWAWNGTAWEELGTAVDLSGYVETSDITIATDNQIDALFA